MPNLKNRPGIIPLFLLIAFGIVFLAGGFYIVRNEFLKTSPGKKAVIDEAKVKDQFNNPQQLSSPTLKASPAFQKTPITYNSSEDPKASSKPAFTITAPSNWGKTSYGGPGETVVFEAPSRDIEESKDQLNYFLYPNIQINITPVLSSAYFDGIIQTHLATYFEGNASTQIITKEKTTLNGQEAYYIEANVTTDKGGHNRMAEYILSKNDYKIVVAGIALESKWSQRVGEIKASLGTFKFTD